MVGKIVVAIAEEETVVAAQEAAIDAVVEGKGAATVAEATVTAEDAPSKGDVAVVVSLETDQATFLRAATIAAPSIAEIPKTDVNPGSTPPARPVPFSLRFPALPSPSVDTTT